MFTRPTDLTDDDVADAFLTKWGHFVDEIEYAPVGFGSHHWQARIGAERWFLTVDDLDLHGPAHRDERRRQLLRALMVAAALRHAGRRYVVAVAPSRSDNIAEMVGERYLLAAYPFVDGESCDYGPYQSAAQRRAVLECLVDIHNEVPLQQLAQADDFVVSSRAVLDEQLTHLDHTWDTGPFGESTRQLLASHRLAVLAVFADYDRLVEQVRTSPESFVITHGEPHRGNVIFTTDGPALIDWDTTLLAPPERDLWALIDEDLSIADTYEAASGRRLNDDALQLYRLRWDLTEVALYVRDFSRPHVDSKDTRTAWAGLQKHLDPQRWTT